jgi:hypothetical protein
MAKQKIDVSGYLNWEKVTMPGGQELYIVPGSGLAYDPFLSRMQGRSVFRPNPKPALDQQQKAEAEKQAQINLAKQQASPLGQLIPIGGGIAALAAGRAVTNAMPSATEEAILNSIPKAPAITGAGAASTATGPAVQTAGNAAAAAATGGAAPTAVGSATMADGSVVAAPAAAAPSAFSLGGIGAAGNVYLPALGAYGAYNLFTHENGLGRGIAQGAASGAAIGSTFGMPIVGAGIGAVVGGVESFLDNPSTKELEQKRWGKLAKTA